MPLSLSALKTKPTLFGLFVDIPPDLPSNAPSIVSPVRLTRPLALSLAALTAAEVATVSAEGLLTALDFLLFGM